MMYSQWASFCNSRNDSRMRVILHSHIIVSLAYACAGNGCRSASCQEDLHGGRGLAV